MQMIPLPHWLEASGPQMTSERWPFKSALWALCPQPLVLSTEPPGPAQWGLQSLGKLCPPGSDTDHIISAIPKVSMSAAHLGARLLTQSPLLQHLLSALCCLFSGTFTLLSCAPLSPRLALCPSLLSLQKDKQPPYLSLIQFTLDTSFRGSRSPPCQGSVPSICVFVPIPSVLSRVGSSTDGQKPFPGSLGQEKREAWSSFPTLWAEPGGLRCGWKEGYLGLGHQDGAKR